MSILTLLKQNGMASFPQLEIEPSKMDNQKINNPDIRGDKSGTVENIKSNAYEKIKGSAHYLLFQNQRFDKLKKKPLNGDFLRLKYDTNYGGKSYNQQLEGESDPDNMMRKINPVRAPPYDYITGAEGLNFRDLPRSVFFSEDSSQLLAKARNSYGSRLSILGELPSLQINNMAGDAIGSLIIKNSGKSNNLINNKSKI
jgi:hypothetical protein